MLLLHHLFPCTILFNIMLVIILMHLIDYINKSCKNTIFFIYQCLFSYKRLSKQLFIIRNFIYMYTLIHILLLIKHY